MFKIIQAKYDFTDYQMAQLRYFFLTITAEISKLLIMGIYFRNDFPIYIGAIMLLHLLRSSSGGIHCKTYWGCFFLSFIFMFLAIDVLPHFSVNRFFQLVALLICIMLSHHIGPITSKLHPVLSEQMCQKLKLKNFFVIFIFAIFLFIIPANRFLCTGFWIIILNTLQLTIAKICTKEVQQ